MTKVRSSEECLAAIQADSAWRKKEIAALSGLLMASDPHLEQVVCRSALVMVYAHWEGFVKTACSLYLDHINEVISRSSAVLTAHFTDLLMWKSFRRKGDHQFLRNPVPFLQMRVEWTGNSGELLPLDVVDTESNLNSRVLKRLLTIIGLDFGGFETKEKLIDDRLLKTRNDIAHGERIPLVSSEYREIESEIRNLIDIFQQEIERCVQEGSYLHR